MLDRVFLFCCFFPFVSPYPIGSDVQPLAGIFAFFIILKNVLKSHSIEKHNFIILLIPFLLLAYNNPFGEGVTADAGKMISTMFGAVILVGFYYAKDKLDAKLFSIVILIYFVFTLLLLMFTKTKVSGPVGSTT